MEYETDKTIIVSVVAAIVSIVILLLAFSAYAQPVSMTTYDTTPPTIVSTNADNLVQTPPVSVSYQVEDLLSGVEEVALYEYVGDTWEKTEFVSPDTVGTLTHSNLLGDGTYRLAVVATDFAGNSTAPAEGEFTVVVDSTPPVVELLGGSTINLGTNITYQEPGVTATDDVSGDVTSSVTVSSTLTSAPGIFEVSYTAEDEVGNVSEPVTRTVVIDNYVEAEEPVLMLVADQIQLSAIEFAYQTLENEIVYLEQDKSELESELQESQTRLANVIRDSGDTIMALQQEFQQDRDRLAELTAVIRNSREFRNFIIVIKPWLPEWFNNQ